MTTIDELLHSIEQAPRGPQVCAIFDFDGTIISGFSATTFLREQLRRGDISLRQLTELINVMTRFGLGDLSFSALMAVSAQYMAGIEAAAYEEVGEKLFRESIARLVYPESRRLIEAHRAAGHTIAIISSATPYQVMATARDLDITEVMCTQLEIKRGRFTGKVVHPACFGQGKVDAAEQLARRHRAVLDDSFFYSDSTDDRLLLERVGHPRALNPSSKLRNLARERDWPIASFGSRGRPTLNQFLRSVAATVSLVPSFAAGLPIYALTGSRREALNFSLSLFADAASALINLDLEVHGEHNLWAQRPAVFVFNHQSKADVVIVARLLRQDLAGVGKREIKKMPVIGKVLELGGVVMIDRKNAASAIEAMAPLVEAMREQGKSVAMAPEGTRTVSPKLGPFKKGAFHLAMQAGVPIVPIVIHNAGDVAPKGDFVFRPATVRVDVLPPVDTDSWRPETIGQHVDEVRGLFLQTLGQVGQTAADSKPAAASARKPGPGAKAKAKAKLKTKAKTTEANAPTAAKAPAKSATNAGAKTKAKAKAKAKTATKAAATTKTTTKTPMQTKAGSKAKSGSKAVKQAAGNARPGARRPARAIKPKLADAP
jgi:putative phosphoserine phosphatase/1-acylglycerol-3-phosphate O-acyltransferase